MHFEFLITLQLEASQQLVEGLVAGQVGICLEYPSTFSTTPSHEILFFDPFHFSAHSGPSSMHSFAVWSIAFCMRRVMCIEVDEVYRGCWECLFDVLQMHQGNTQYNELTARSHTVVDPYQENSMGG